MKATEHFNNIIETYLRDRAETDTLFAVSFAKEDKNIQDCITYYENTNIMTSSYLYFLYSN